MKRRDERGSAMLLSILAIAVLGAGLMGVMMMTSVERRAVLDQQSRSDAMAVAESGLDRFVAEREALGFTSSPAGAYESTRVNVSGGHADVVLQRIRPAVGASAPLYLIRSRGVAQTAQLAGVPASQRTVSQLASWQSSGMAAPAALTAITGLTKESSSGALSGADICGVQANVAGVAVPGVPGYVQTGGGASTPSGSPGILSLGATATLAAAAVGIDWNGIVNRTSVTPDLNIPSAAWPSFADPGYWPIIMVTGNYALPTSGRGVLIVTGSLTFATNGANWAGVILVGDRLIVTANTSVQGAVIAGLNVKLGGTAAASSIASGNKVFRYSSCNVASALSRFGGLVLMPDTWTDNWSW